MTARSITELRQGLALGTQDAAAFSAAETDEAIRQVCRTLYGWEQVELIRDGTIVRARPMSSLAAKEAASE